MSSPKVDSRTENVIGESKRGLEDNTPEYVPYFSLNHDLTDQTLLGNDFPPEYQEEYASLDPLLAHTWCYWESYKCDETTREVLDYDTSLSKLHEFNTVKGFWQTFIDVLQPSKLFEGNVWQREMQDGSLRTIESTCIFKKGVKPVWEDPMNRSGHLELRLMPKLIDKVPLGMMDELWNNAVTAIIADDMAACDMITGMRLVDKMGAKYQCVRLEFWYHETEDEKKLNGGKGRLYELKGALERAFQTSLDGSRKPLTWGYTQQMPHELRRPDRMMEEDY